MNFLNLGSHMLNDFKFCGLELYFNEDSLILQHLLNIRSRQACSRRFILESRCGRCIHIKSMCRGTKGGKCTPMLSPGLLTIALTTVMGMYSTQSTNENKSSVSVEMYSTQSTNEKIDYIQLDNIIVCFLRMPCTYDAAVIL